MATLDALVLLPSLFRVAGSVWPADGSDQYRTLGGGTTFSLQLSVTQAKVHLNPMVWTNLGSKFVQVVFLEVPEAPSHFSFASCAVPERLTNSLATSSLPSCFTSSLIQTLFGQVHVSS